MRNIILENRDYIKNKKVFDRKIYLDKLSNSLNTKNIIILEGQRRVGKSSLIVSYLKSKNIDFDDIFYINKELDLLGDISDVKSLDEIFNYFKKKFRDPKYIIIDEVQDIDGWEKFVRKYQALGIYKIILTGSNSKLLSGELSTYLTGRYLSIEVFPFLYEEFLNFKTISPTKEAFLEYIEYGGMPEILFIKDKETKKNYLKSVLNSILLKDIVGRYNIRDIKLLEKILMFLANNTGSLVSITNISKYLSVQFKKEYSTKTIANYIRYLEFPYLINEVPRYDIGGKKIFEYVSKYYFTDVGFANIYGFTFANDIGKVLENLVYLKLKSMGYDVFVGEKNGYEIDFVGKKEGEKIYIQVTYLFSNEEVVKREFGNLEKIKDNYKKIVVSMDDTFGNTYNGIEHINIEKFLLINF